VAPRTVTDEAYRPEPQVPFEHYWSRAYNSKARVCSYWHQVDEVLALGARTVLEVGPGGGFVTNWLRAVGMGVTTFDMDAAVGADINGSVTDIPLDSGSFDVALCSQVLEHLPFEDAARAVGELARVSRTGVVVSFPDATPWAGAAYPLYFPGWYIEEMRTRMPDSRWRLLKNLARRRVRLRDWLFARVVPAEWSIGGRTLELRRLPIPRGPWRPEPRSQHFWEIGAEGVPLERVVAALEGTGLSIAQDYRVPENPWHHFFVLRHGG
jgi:SAM-dependent methyltransferase